MISASPVAASWATDTSHAGNLRSSGRRGPWQSGSALYTTEENERYAEHDCDVCDVEYTCSPLPDACAQKIKDPAVVDTTIEQVAEPSTQNASCRNDVGTSELG